MLTLFASVGLPYFLPASPFSWASFLGNWIIPHFIVTDSTIVCGPYLFPHLGFMDSACLAQTLGARAYKAFAIKSTKPLY